MVQPRFIFAFRKLNLLRASRMKAKENRPVKKVHLTNFRIAGFSYWDGPEAFEQLKVGTRLDLVREPDNQFDPYAVAVYLGDFKLGFIPRGENHDISKYLDMGLDDIYEVRVQRISPDEHPENQVEVIVYIKNQNK